MKAYLITSLVLFLNLSSFAQFNESLSYIESNHSQLSPLFVKSPEVTHVKMAALPPGYRMKNVGSALTLAGSLLVVGGVIIYRGSDKTSTNYYGNKTTDPEAKLGTYMIVAGAGMIIPGAIIWINGTSKYKRYQAEKTSINTTASLRFMGNGIVYRF